MFYRINTQSFHSLSCIVSNFKRRIFVLRRPTSFHCKWIDILDYLVWAALFVFLQRVYRITNKGYGRSHLIDITHGELSWVISQRYHNTEKCFCVIGDNYANVIFYIWTTDDINNYCLGFLLSYLSHKWADKQVEYP